MAILSACVPPQPSQTRAPARRFFAATLFSKSRVVAYYGEPGVPAMGVLGSGTPEAVASRLIRQASAYARFGKRVTSAFEVIAVAAQGAPGARDLYHGASDLASARRYLIAARKVSGLLLIDIQPGRERFLPLVKQFEPLLLEPDVGIALDSEWEMGPKEVPGETIGGTTGAEVNGVAAYLAAIVRAHRLPQKLFVIHQFTPDMIEHRNAIHAYPELATTFNIDGFGGHAIKLLKYKTLATTDPRFHNGLKLFYDQDVNMFAPADVMRLRPRPDLITYQ